MGDAQGLTFDSAVREYDQGRTGWPEAVVAGVQAADVLELGAGTGKLTRLLVGRFSSVVAVEPLPGMRSLGSRLVPEAVWVDGAAETIPVADASFDAAFVAEAYHWFDAERATAELARVLRPGGQLVVLFAVWHGSWQPELPLAARAAVQAVAERTGPAGGAKWTTGAWRSGFREDEFAPLEEREVPFEHRTDRDGVIAYALSISSIAARPESERAALAQELRTLVPDRDYRLDLAARIYSTTRL